jgi:hypothetical protein
MAEAFKRGKPRGVKPYWGSISVHIIRSNEGGIPMAHRDTLTSIPSPAKLNWRTLAKKARAWLPSRGNVIFTVMVAAALVWAARVGAMPLNAPLAQGASTSTVAYQGRLADAGGTPLTGTYSMIFRLYSAASGGVPLWEEQWTGPNSVAVSDGLFNVMLGSLTPIPQSVITENDSLWLGITVGTDDEMTPRVQLGSVPYTFRANQATEADHATNADHAINADQADQATNADQADHAASADYAYGLSASDDDPLDAVTVDADGRVTISGLHDPTWNELEIKNGRIGFHNGLESLDGGSAGFGERLCQAPDGGSCDFYTGYAHGGLILVHEWHSNADGFFGQKLYMLTANSSTYALLTQISAHGSNSCSISYIGVENP